MHVIVGLSMGGAENALFRLVCATTAHGISHSVVTLADTFRDGGADVFTQRFRDRGVPVTSLGLRQGVPDPRAVVRLARMLRDTRPDVVHSWMYHANLLAGVASAIAGVPNVWGIRHADADPRHAKRMTYWTNRICAQLSGVLAARVVCCAISACESHRALGYRGERLLVIPNGFDTRHFVRDADARLAIRAELGIHRDAPVVGVLARYHPDKGHDTLLAAAERVVAERPGTIFVLAGQRVEWSNADLVRGIDQRRLRDSVRLLGVRSDVAALLSAMDVLASPSRTEAFPQVLGEAMSAGVPCAATDAGDSREIIGDTGRIVPVGDGAALAGAIVELLAMSPAKRSAMGAAAQQRVRERYDLDVVTRRYESLYSDVARAEAAAC